MFSQAVQSQPTPAQPGVYNNMSITVSMAGGNTNVQNMNPMMGQMQMSSLQMPGMNTVCPEQVSGTAGMHTTHHESLFQGKSGMFAVACQKLPHHAVMCVNCFSVTLGGEDALLYFFPTVF